MMIKKNKNMKNSMPQDVEKKKYRNEENKKDK